MKVFFDTNVYVAEALLGAGAESQIRATLGARWRVYISDYVLDEIERVMTDYLDASHRFARLTRNRCARRATRVIDRESRHHVPHDSADSPILTAAISVGADYLVTNDRHLLALHPYESLKIISMKEYGQMLEEQGLL